MSVKGIAPKYVSLETPTEQIGDMLVAWGITRVITRGLASGKYYAAYWASDRRFMFWRKRKEIMRIKKEQC